MKQLDSLTTAKQALDEGANIALPISGGKDSQALLKEVWEQLPEYRGQFFAIHADLGRVEWPQTKLHCEKLCTELGIPFVVVTRKKGDLLARWEERMELLKGTNTPFWSSARNRYCTSDLKREPINKYLRNYHGLIISAEGIRAQESKARSEKEIYLPRPAITTKLRKAFTWNAILTWDIEDVWATYEMTTEDLKLFREEYKDTGLINPKWPFHPVYVMGNDRVSCALCILGSRNDLQNGVKHNPELARKLASMEVESGFTFRQDIAIKDLL